MPYYYMNGGDWGWGVGFSILWFLVFILVVLFIFRAFQRHGSPDRWDNSPEPRDPLDIARERYARGDITKEQFRDIKRELQSGSSK